MRSADIPTTRELARHILAYEEAEVTRAVSTMPAAVRVCDKLRRPLGTLVGSMGFYSLLARALSLAKQESPALSMWEVEPDGSLQVFGSEATQSSAVLVAHLIGLMITFIGNSLTLRLLHDIWLELPDYQADAERKEIK